MVWASPVCTEYSRALTMRPRRLEEGDVLVLRALEIMEHFDPLMWVIENPATGLLKTRSWSAYPQWTSPTASTGLRTGSRPDCGPTCAGDRGAAGGATRGRTGGALKGGLDSWGVSVRGLGGSRASCFIAFLRRCARRLRVRSRQSLRIGRASRTEARGISYMSIFFPSTHALRRRPISRPTWHTATARRLRLRTLGRTCS